MTQAAPAATTPGARRSGRRTARRPRPTAAAASPIARIVVDVPLPHLDRPFDYLVPQQLSDAAVPGSRVRVRFAGRLIGGYITERTSSTDRAGRLAFLERVVSPEPVLTDEIAGLARAVADRYGGTLADVLRLAIPPRHAAAESAPPAVSGSEDAVVPPALPGSPGEVRPGHWERYRAGPAFLAALADGRKPRAVWSALPGPDWPEEIARAVAATAASGRGTIVIVPDARDLEQVDTAISELLGPAVHVSLAAQLGAAERYRRWLSVLRGQIKIVTGTRSAMFAPVSDLGLVVIWDEGDDLHAEPRAPYPHARDVLLLRAHRSHAAALVGGFARTAEAAQLIATGWARSLAADRGTVRRAAPSILPVGEDEELARDEAARTARMPALALRTAREGLEKGPVLFQVPRRGYLAAVACGRCGRRIRCPACVGPVALAGHGQPLRCGWCGSEAPSECPECRSSVLRALVTGERRTAEELSRAFPGVTVRTSSGSDVVSKVPGSAAIVIATPGAEPAVPGGYAAAVLLDGWSLLGRPSLRAAEEALRRWMNAAALVRPGSAGGRVVVMAESHLRPVQALIRWDPVTHAERELAERDELRLPPAVRMAALTGAPGAVRDLLKTVRLPQGAELLGSVPAGSGGQSASEDGDVVRYLVRARAADGTGLAVALRDGLAARSAAKKPGQVRLRLDPADVI